MKFCSMPGSGADGGLIATLGSGAHLGRLAGVLLFRVVSAASRGAGMALMIGRRERGKSASHSTGVVVAVAPLVVYVIGAKVARRFTVDEDSIGPCPLSYGTVAVVHRSFPIRFMVYGVHLARESSALSGLRVRKGHAENHRSLRLHRGWRGKVPGPISWEVLFAHDATSP